MKRLLFVDDDPKVLVGIKRMLRSMSTEWEMVFAQSGHEALTLMDQKPFDVIVSDMRMPGMDGAALLSEVRKRHPQTVRFVLSGHSDREAILRAVGPTHQFLAKPCDEKGLKDAVVRALGLRDLIHNEALERLASQTLTLPPMPSLYAKLAAELQLAEASIGAVGKIIEGDPGMSAKVLQWVNSAFFGIPQIVSSVTQAVNLLGLDTIQALVLSAGVFEQASKTGLPPCLPLEAVWQHSKGVGVFARAVAKAELKDPKEIGNAFTAGVLHDAGKLVLGSGLPSAYRDAFARATNEGIPLCDVELDVFGATHARVGAYLLALWGLPDRVVEAVALHHRPSERREQAFGAATAVHVANVFDHEGNPERIVGPAPELDNDHLQELGMEGRIPAWRDLCLAVHSDKDEYR